VRPSTIAIDGPAASGKSTIGFYLAQHLGYLYLDTGVLYRAATWAVQDRSVDVSDEAAVTSLVEGLSIDVTPPTVNDGRQCTVRVNGVDVSWEIRSPRVESAVSPVSAYPGVRASLTERMRAIARNGHVVMVGRDIGTVVIPNADLKLYVTASAEARASRRLLELQAKGKTLTYEQVLAGIRERDHIDSHRKAAPLRPADDATMFDTTTLTMEAMFSAVETLVDDCRTKNLHKERNHGTA